MLKLVKIIKKQVILSENCLGIDMVRTASQDQVKGDDKNGKRFKYQK